MKTRKPRSGAASSCVSRARLGSQPHIFNPRAPMDQLTRNCLYRLLGENEEFAEFTVQITGWKKVMTRNDGEKERARLQISDGDNKLQTVVGVSQIVELLNDGELENTGIVRVTAYQLNKKAQEGDTQPRQILVLTHGTVVEQSVGTELGKPRLMDCMGRYPDAVAPSRSTEQQPLAPAQPRAAEVRPREVVREEMPEVKKPRVEEPRLLAAPPKPRPSQAGLGIFAISGINPYQSKWKIRARVMHVDPLRKYSNARGEGQIFSVELADATGAIKATAFKEQALKFHDILKKDKIYDISNCQVKQANKRFSSLNNDYELMFNNNTEVEWVQGDDIGIPTSSYSFVSLQNLPNCQKDQMIDVIGVVKSVGDMMQLTSRAGKELQKRDVVLVDDSKFSVNLTLWGDQAAAFQPVENEGHVLAVKSVRVGDFGGVSLSTVSSSSIDRDPDVDKAHVLAGWWSTNAGVDVASLSRSGGGGNQNDPPVLIGLSEAWNLGTDVTGKPEYFNVRGTVINIKAADALYKACPEEKCNKRVIENSDTFRCEKCNKEFDKFKWAAMIQLEMMDMTGNKWMTLFGDSCKAFTGRSASELGEMRERSNDEFTDLFNDLLFRTYYFRVSAKQETYNDQTSIKWRCYSVRAEEGEEAPYVDKVLADGLAKLNAL